MRKQGSLRFFGKAALAISAAIGALVFTRCDCAPIHPGALFACEPDGSCPSGRECRQADWVCTAPEDEADAGPNDAGGADACVPVSCAGLGKSCGQLSDGCGGLLDCGSCSLPLVCGATEQNVCGCPSGGGPSGSETTCGDRLDNDCDGVADCDDADCEQRACDDRNACTSQDACRSGTCLGAESVSCRDGGGPCRALAGACSPDSGLCVYPPLDAGAGCPDDGIFCTDDRCDGLGSCVHPPKDGGTPCDDGNPCTAADRCSASACVGGPTKPCNSPPGGGCFLVQGACNPADAGCLYLPADAGTPCPSDGNPCTDDRCNGTGACQHPPRSGPCNDDNACTTGDYCDAGACTFTGMRSCAQPAPSSCWASSACIPADGGCQLIPKSMGMPCPDDGNQCTLDECDGDGGCQHPDAPNGLFCNDGLACTTNDECLNGACTGTSTCLSPPQSDCYQLPGTCDISGCLYYPSSSSTLCTSDNEPCTTDRCNGSGNCQHTPVPNGTSCLVQGQMCGFISKICKVCQSGVCTVNSPYFDSSCSPSCQGVDLYCSGTYRCCDGGSGCLGEPVYDCLACCQSC
ncbi:MAG: hypothetical protein HYZ28_10850 [Myxococcales bacterium]|nr:hypothetical protein [Myxococcales bacterium]